MNAMRKAQEAAQLAADYWMGYEGTTGVRGDKERAQEAEHSMFKWATLAQAEAAERQAAAMERMAAAVEYATGKMHADISGDMLRIANEFMDGMKADDQRAEDEQGYNAEVAKVAEFNKRWGFEK